MLAAPLEVRTDAPSFRRDATRLTRTNPDLDAVLATAIVEIARNDPDAWGVAIPGFGHRIWKKRLPGQGRGRRGGLRLIFEVDRTAGHATLLLLYAKNERADVIATEIDRARQRAADRT